MKNDLNSSSKYVSGVCYDLSMLLSFLDKTSYVEHYAFIYHDSDDSEPHYHFLLCLARSRRLSDVLNSIKKEGTSNVLVESCLSPSSIVRYFVHADDSDKFQYSVDCIVSDTDLSYFDSLPREKPVKEDFVLNAFLDLTDSLPVSVCAKKYGRDFIIHYNHIKALLLDSGLVLDKGVYRPRGDLVNYYDDFMYRYKCGKDDDVSVSRETKSEVESEIKLDA